MTILSLETHKAIVAQQKAWIGRQKRVAWLNAKAERIAKGGPRWLAKGGPGWEDIWVQLKHHPEMTKEIARAAVFGRVK